MLHTWRAARYLAAPYPRTCPICGYKGLFSPFGWPVRPEAQCRGCGSLERHRLVKLWLEENGSLVRDKRVLHFAPDALAHVVKPLAREYTTADLYEAANLRVNIENMSEVPSGRFDVVVCSHVLEHVDDRAALREIHRILAPGGVALILTPVVEGWSSTYQDPSITLPLDRAVHFGQSDHIRVFGSDVRQRMAEAGFLLSEFTAIEPAALIHGLLRGEKIFVCRR
jgi:SAM-dependent methyltransferase